MYHLSLIRTNYLFASFKEGIKKLSTYNVSPIEYACRLIFPGVLPGYYFNWFDSDCGNSIKEMWALTEKHKLSGIRFLENLLRKTTTGKLSLMPHLGVEKNICIHIKEFNDIREFDLELFNLDDYWKKLNSSDIDSIIKKSSQKWYDF